MYLLCYKRNSSWSDLKNRRSLYLSPMCFCSWLLLNLVDPDQELKWLIQTLLKAEKNAEKVGGGN